MNELTFWKKLNDMERILARKQGISRGYFTYTELENLSTTIELANLVHCLVAVSLLLATTYTAGVLTIVGSMFLTSQIPGNCLQPTNVALMPNRSFEIVNMLKTGIILASMKTNDTIPIENSHQNMTWDWWNVPVMNWLTKASAEMEFNTKLFDFSLWNYFDSSFINAKQVHLNNCINKATKTRIQDQLETSWHEEWTDTVKYRLVYNQLYYNYFKS